MVFTSDDRIIIKTLRIEKGYGARRLLKEFPTRPWSLTSVSRLLEKIDATGSASRKAGSGRPSSACTNDNAAIVADLVLSQDDAPRTHRTIREIARETSIHRSSVHRIIHKQLSLKCFRKKRAQELTDANKLTRLTRATQLLKQYPKHMVPFIFFTDEKLFTVASPVNMQNNRLYAPSTTKKRDLAAERCLCTRSNFSKSVMVSVAVSELGSTDLIFIDPGVKINGAYYRSVLLTEHLLPSIKRLSSNAFFIFQQDSAPAHRAKETVELLRREAPDFISPLLWPPNSPDLNPVDYKIWSVLQERVYKTRIRDVTHLRERLVEEWAAFDNGIIERAVQQWRGRLRACIKAEGGHFEQRMQ
jgi:transposase